MLTDERVTMGTRFQTGRRPKVQAPGRVCAEESCDTTLSIYNRSERCHRHQPIRYPRARP